MEPYSLNEIAEFERIELLEENLNAFSYRNDPEHIAKFYLFFVARKSDDSYYLLDENKLTSAIKNKEIKFVNFFTGEEYTVSASYPDPDNNSFFVSKFFIRNNVNIIEVTAGAFKGYAPISVIFKTDATKAISTEFMAMSGFESRVLIYQEK
ncbi:hypothetical protein ACBQ20_15685 [Proteus vulgaris]|uniref:hypothetical protein n=1 Tax=Proteus TaxID=583 RepID=UPI0032DA4130